MHRPNGHTMHNMGVKCSYSHIYRSVCLLYMLTIYTLLLIELGLLASVFCSHALRFIHSAFVFISCQCIWSFDLSIGFSSTRTLSLSFSPFHSRSLYLYAFRINEQKKNRRKCETIDKCWFAALIHRLDSSLTWVLFYIHNIRMQTLFWHFGK